MATTFNPIQQFSFADEHDRTVANQEANNQVWNQAMNLRFQQQDAEAQKAGADWEALQNLTKTGLQLAQKRAEENKITGEAEGKMKFHEDLRNGSLYAKQEVEEWKELDNQGQKEELDTLKIAKKAADDGAEQDTVDDIRQLSGHQLVGYAKAHLAYKGKLYPAWLSEQMMTNDTLRIERPDGSFYTPKTAKTEIEKRTALKQLGVEYIKQDGLSEYNRAALSLYLLDDMFEAEGAYDRLITKQGNVERSQTTRSEATESLVLDGSMANFFTKVGATTKDDGQTIYSNTDTWTFWENTLIERVLTGGFDPWGKDADAYQKMKDEIIPEGAPGAGKKYGDFHKQKFLNLESKLVEAKIQHGNNLEKERTARQISDADDMILNLEEQLKDDPNLELDGAAILNQWNSKWNGETPPKKLTRWISANTKSPEQNVRDYETAELNYEQGTLTQDMVNKLPFKYREEFQQKLILQGDPEIHKDNRRGLTRLVIDGANLGDVPNAKDNPDVQGISAELHQFYQKAFRDNIKSGMPLNKAREQALQATKIKWSEEGGDRSTRSGKQEGRYYFNGTYLNWRKAKQNELTKDKAETNAYLSRAVTLSKSGKSNDLILDTKDGIFTKEDITRIDMYHEKHGIFPANVRALANHLGVSPYELINRQKKTHVNEYKYSGTTIDDLPEILRPLTPPTEAGEVMEGLREVLTKEDMRLLTTYPSPNRAVRALVGSDSGPEVSELPENENASTETKNMWLAAVLPGQELAQIASINTTGMQFIKDEEASTGFESKAYIPVEGDVPTIGYGNTFYQDGTPVQMGDTISEKDANELFEYQVNRVENILSQSIPNWDDLNPNIQAGLASFAYNLGEYFYGSEGFETITAAIESGDPQKIAEALTLYNQGPEGVLEGLVNRRKREGDLVTTPYGTTYATGEYTGP